MIKQAASVEAYVSFYLLDSQHSLLQSCDSDGHILSWIAVWECLSYLLVSQDLTHVCLQNKAQAAKWKPCALTESHLENTSLNSEERLDLDVCHRWLKHIPCVVLDIAE